MPTEVDTSSYPKFNQQDPLAIPRGVQALQTSILQNRLAGQNLESKIVGGRAITGAIDPATGLPDQAKVGRFFTDHPEYGQFGAEAIAQAQQLNTSQLANIGQEYTNKRAQLGLTEDQGKLLSSNMLPFIQQFSTPDPATGKTPTPTKKQFSDAVINTIVQMGPAADANILGRAAALLQNASDDPEELKRMAKSLALIGNPSPETVNMLYGPTDKTDLGAGVAITRTPGLGGAPTVAGVLDKGLSPETENTPAYTYVDPKTNIAHIVTKREAAATAAGPTPDATPGGIASGMPVGSQEAAAAAVQQASALQQRAGIVPARRAALRNIVDTLSDITPGPKADWTYTLGALATQFGLASPKVTKGVAAQEEFNKLAAQISLDQWGVMGGSGSNEQLATAMKANPNVTMSKMGVKNVAALLLGNEDAIGAQYGAWTKYKATHGPASYGDFLSGWNRYYDPRVYQAEHMVPGALKVMIGKMTPDERKTFNRNKSIAQQAGWLGGQ